MIKFSVDGNFCLNYYVDMQNLNFNEPLTKIKNPDHKTGDIQHCYSRPSEVAIDQAYNCTQYNVRCDFSAKKNNAWSPFSGVVVEAAHQERQNGKHM